MRRLTLMLAPLISLAGCATAPGGCDLLPLREYDRATEVQLADELDAAPEGSVWPGVVVDYAALRDAVRACRGLG